MSSGSSTEGESEIYKEPNLIITSKNTDHIKYEVVALIGEGGFSKVYKVTQQTGNDRGRDYALKVMTKTDENEKMLALNECNILTILSTSSKPLYDPHPNIIRLKEYWIEEKDKNVSKYYLIMDLLGPEFLKYIEEKENDRPLSYTYCFMKQLLSAVAYIHSKGIIHRDLKLENVAVTLSDRNKKNQPVRIKLIDFGMALILPQDGKYVDAPPSGTPEYIAPEVFNQLGNISEDYTIKISPAVDEWCCGIMLFAIVYGGYPFLTDRENPLLFTDQYEKEMNVYQESYNMVSFENAFPFFKNQKIVPKIPKDIKFMITELLNPIELKRTKAHILLQNKWIQECVDDRFAYIPIKSRFNSLINRSKANKYLRMKLQNEKNNKSIIKIPSLYTGSIIYIYKDNNECLLFKKGFAIDGKHDYQTICEHKLDMLEFVNHFESNKGLLKDKKINLCYKCNKTT